VSTIDSLHEPLPWNVPFKWRKRLVSRHDIGFSLDRRASADQRFGIALLLGEQREDGQRRLFPVLVINFCGVPTREKRLCCQRETQRHATQLWLAEQQPLLFRSRNWSGLALGLPGCLRRRRCRRRSLICVFIGAVAFLGWPGSA